MDTDSLLIMLVVSFALALVLILKKDSIPDKLRRPLALFALFMVSSSFLFLLITLFRLGMD